MAAPTAITLANFTTLLVESTQGRAGVPDGNIFFDQTNDRVEVITLEELATVDLGSGVEANPLTNDLGITVQALYAFERQQRNGNVALREFLPGMEGRFQDAGAWAFVAGVKPSDAVESSTGDDRTKFRGSGWREFSDNNATVLDRVYFGGRSLNNIEATSQPFVQIPASLSEADLQAAAPINADRLGPLDEAFQVFGDTANGDAGAGDFDFRLRPLVAGVRTFGFTQGQTTSIATGLARLEGFSTGLGFGEAPNPSAAFNIADVFGGAAIAPFTGVLFQRETAPINRTGFNEADGLFTDTITNSAGATLAEIRAKLDAIMQQDTDQNANTGSTGPFLPLRAEPLYTVDANTGQLVFRQGLFVENIPTADNQSVRLVDDAGDTKTFPFANEIRVAVSDAWFDDPNAWYQAFFADGAGNLDFDVDGNAVTVEDASSSPISGIPGDARAFGVAGSREVRFSFDYSGNAQAGLPANSDKTIVFLAEGDGGATAGRATINIVAQAVITADASASPETNI